MINPTFSMIPSQGLEETLEWKTDILTSKNGKQARLSLRELPRRSVSANFPVVTQEDRVEMIRLLQHKIQTIHVCPDWAYSSTLTQESPEATNRLFFDVKRTDLTVGRPIAVIDRKDKSIFVSYVSFVHSNGVSTEDYYTKDMVKNSFVCPATEVMIEDNSAIKWNSMAGAVSVSFSSWVEYPMIRADNSVVLDTFNSIPVLDRFPSGETSQGFTFRREVIDNSLGLRKLSSYDTFTRISGSRIFSVNRVLEPLEMDWFRTFFNEIKGSWKPFFVSTFLDDYKMTRAPLNSSSYLYVEGNSDDVDRLSQSANSRIHVRRSNGRSSYHRIDSIHDFLDGEIRLTLIPSLPPSGITDGVLGVSMLLKATMSDTVRLTHGSFETAISIEFNSVNG